MKIIHHSRDLDGHCSGAILKMKFPQAELIGYDYGQPIPEVADGDDVILVDVSFPTTVMILMAGRCKSFVWIDHHISAMKDYWSYPAPPAQFIAVLNDKISACEGAWLWAFPNEEMPLAVRLLGIYDTWRNQDLKYWEETVLPFQYGMRAMCQSADSFPLPFFNYTDLEELTEITSIGKIILEYQRTQDEFAAKNCFEFEWKGYKILALNGGGFNSRAFISQYDPAKHDIMMPFRYNGKVGKWDFSLYTEKEIDCSALAKEMGGGGHRKAAGFQVVSLGTVIPGQ